MSLYQKIGLTVKQFENIFRNMTSKCKNLKDLEEGHLKFHGYRGIALSSIRHISSVLQIITREKDGEYQITFDIVI